VDTTQNWVQPFRLALYNIFPCSCSPMQKVILPLVLNDHLYLRTGLCTLSKHFCRRFENNLIKCGIRWVRKLHFASLINWRSWANPIAVSASSDCNLSRASFEENKGGSRGGDENTFFCGMAFNILMCRSVGSMGTVEANVTKMSFNYEEFL